MRAPACWEWSIKGVLLVPCLLGILSFQQSPTSPSLPCSISSRFRWVKESVLISYYCKKCIISWRLKRSQKSLLQFNSDFYCVFSLFMIKILSKPTSFLQNNHKKPTQPTLGIHEAMPMDMPRHPSPAPQAPPQPPKSTPPPPMTEPPPQVPVMPVPVSLMQAGPPNGHPMFMHNGGPPPTHPSAYSSGAIPKTTAVSPPSVQPCKTSGVWVISIFTIRN